MYHVIFDIDGTLIESFEFDEWCFLNAVKTVTGIELNHQWETYPHVTDRGILQTFIERQAPHLDLGLLEQNVKAVFISNIQKHIRESTVNAVAGAKEFLETLSMDRNFVISIATGGWRETAILKLQAAGFDTTRLTIYSSNDHYSRTTIMTLAIKGAKTSQPVPVTYFGDAEWDIRACQDLNINLGIIGNRVSYHQTLPNFLNTDKALALIKKRQV